MMLWRAFTLSAFLASHPASAWADDVEPIDFSILGEQVFSYALSVSGLSEDSLKEIVAVDASIENPFDAKRKQSQYIQELLSASSQAREKLSTSIDADGQVNFLARFRQNLDFEIETFSFYMCLPGSAVIESSDRNSPFFPRNVLIDYNQISDLIVGLCDPVPYGSPNTIYPEHLVKLTLENESDAERIWTEMDRWGGVVNTRTFCKSLTYSDARLSCSAFRVEFSANMGTDRTPLLLLEATGSGNWTVIAQ